MVMQNENQPFHRNDTMEETNSIYAYFMPYSEIFKFEDNQIRSLGVFENSGVIGAAISGASMQGPDSIFDWRYSWTNTSLPYYQNP